MYIKGALLITLCAISDSVNIDSRITLSSHSSVEPLMKMFTPGFLLGNSHSLNSGILGVSFKWYSGSSMLERCSWERTQPRLTERRSRGCLDVGKLLFQSFVGVVICFSAGNGSRLE